MSYRNLTSKELLPCPFCRKNSAEQNYIASIGEYKAGKFDLNHWCHSGGSPSNITFYGKTEKECIDAWNMRAEGYISVKDQLPKSGQDVFAYFYDTPFEIDQYEILTYYKAGAILEDEEIPKGDTVKERLMNMLFRSPKRFAESDGFYIYDNCETGNRCTWRKHKDCITHWKPLVPPRDTSC